MIKGEIIPIQKREIKMYFRFIKKDDLKRKVKQKQLLFNLKHSFFDYQVLKVEKA